MSRNFKSLAAKSRAKRITSFEQRVVSQIFCTVHFYRPRTKYEGRYCFHRCLSVHISGGEVPHSADGGDPISGPGGGGVGYPVSGPGRGYPVPCPGGYPIPGPGRGYTPSIQDWMGYLPHGPGIWYPAPLIQTWNGVPPCSGLDATWRGMPLVFTQEDFLVWTVFTGRIQIKVLTTLPFFPFLSGFLRQYLKI